MTMSSEFHPDDERLAALAGDDPDAQADRALREHVAACTSCGSAVEELHQLRIALGELPDLVPSRPLRLLPPVPEPVAAGRTRWLRRLMAPVAAAGLVMALVGGAGTAGLFDRLNSAGEAAFQAVGQDLNTTPERHTAATPPEASPPYPPMRGEVGGSPVEPKPLLSASPRVSDSVGFGGQSAEPRSRTPAPAKASPRSTARSAQQRSREPAGAPSPWLIVMVGGLALAAGAIGVRWITPSS
jgi:hypothetical protein